MDLITDSRVEGECEGFDGDRVFELVNGQKWQQAVYRYKYRYRYRPSVRIWRDASGDYIEIEGMDELVRVRRVYPKAKRRPLILGGQPQSEDV